MQQPPWKATASDGTVLLVTLYGNHRGEDEDRTGIVVREEGSGHAAASYMSVTRLATSLRRCSAAPGPRTEMALKRSNNGSSSMLLYARR